MKRRSKEGFVLSALLHGGVVAVAIILPMLDFSSRKTENEFVLVPMPPLAGSSGGGFEGATAAPQEFDFSGPDSPAPQAAPRPKPPTPSPAKPTPTPPTQKKPVTPPKPPATTPAKPTVAKPPPAKETTTAPAMSYEEYVKKFGAPKPTTNKKPPATAGGSPGKRKGPQVDTDFSGVVRDSVVGGSRWGSLTGTEMSALGIYIADLRGALEEAWPKPSGMSDTLATIVEFSVSPDGRISSVRVVGGSGNRAFDQSVLAAFQGVGTVGPPPDGKSLNLRLTFKMNEN